MPLTLLVIALVLLGLFSGIIRGQARPDCLHGYCVGAAGMERAH